MSPFTYITVNDSRAAVQGGQEARSSFLAGGTNLIDEMKINVQTPAKLLDINSLPLDKIEAQNSGSVRIGALVRNSDLARDPLIVQRYPVLSEALLSGASPQLRNLATTAGNLLQHTRCYYYRDVSSPCNMRSPGSGCSAIGGYNRIHAVLGTSDKCIATHPSDMCVAMAALDATVHVLGPDGERDISIDNFHVPYGDDPAKLNVLKAGELITYVELPSLPWAKRSHYLKVRDRASYEFALASAAVVLDLDGKTIRNARLVLGGVATKPWRVIKAEKLLVGQEANAAVFLAAAQEAMADARPQKDNAFKVELAKRTIVRALAETAAI